MPSPTASANAPVRPRRRVPWGIVGLLAVIAFFAAGVIELFHLRFDVGDVYPPYSTLRSDPLGAKVIEASLAALPGLKVERNLRALSSLGREPLRPASADNGEKELTCFLLGLDDKEWPYVFQPEAVDRLEKIMRGGGRVVITFQPAQSTPTVESLSSARAEHDRQSPGGLHGGHSAQRNAKMNRKPDLIARWGLDFRRRSTHSSSVSSSALSTPAEQFASAAPVQPSTDNHEPVAWHSALDFRLDTVPVVLLRWQPLYERATRPVIVSRPFGDAGGQLILVADSYFLSNEGLRDHPSPALISALIGQGHHVIFDESHLGVTENPGLVTLARRYRLQGAIAALALLVALYVWRNVVSLVPAQPSSEVHEADTVLGHSAAAGYLKLLRRGVSPRTLPAVCVEQWEVAVMTARGSTPTAASSRERILAVLDADSALPARRRASVVAAYRAMCAAAKRQKA